MEKKEIENKNIWKSVIIFYARTTSWILIPSILGLFIGKYFSDLTGKQISFFIIIFFSFILTCYGIYKEVLKYKKKLDNSSSNLNKTKEEMKEKNGE